MQTVTSFEPVIGQSVTVNLLQQSGYTEVINDSNFLLIIQTNNGTCSHIPGAVQIYPTPVGGGIFSIQSAVAYLATDPGIADFVTINQYLEEELVGRSYPYFVTRNVSVAQNVSAPFIEAVSVANMTAAFSLQATGSGLPANLPVNAFFHLTGVDLSMDQEATAHGWTLNIFGLFSSPTLQYNGHTKTAADTQLLLRWDPPLISAGQGTNVNVQAFVPAVSGSTARASLNMFGYYQ